MTNIIKLDTDFSLVQEEKTGYHFQPMNWTRGSFYYHYLNGELTIPYYQRGFVRTQEQQLSFVHSVISKIPIPPIIFVNLDMSMKEQLKIIDGQQRLTTMMNYFDWYEKEKGGYRNSKAINNYVPVIQISKYGGKMETFDEEMYYNLFNYGGTPH